MDKARQEFAIETDIAEIAAREELPNRPNAATWQIRRWSGCLNPITHAPWQGRFHRRFLSR
jgi:hypothetical protein